MSAPQHIVAAEMLARLYHGHPILCACWLLTFTGWLILLVLWIRQLGRYNRAYREYEQCRREYEKGHSQPSEELRLIQKRLRNAQQNPGMALKLIRRLGLILGEQDQQLAHQGRLAILMGSGIHVHLRLKAVQLLHNLFGSRIHKRATREKPIPQPVGVSRQFVNKPDRHRAIRPNPRKHVLTIAPRHQSPKFSFKARGIIYNPSRFETELGALVSRGYCQDVLAWIRSDCSMPIRFVDKLSGHPNRLWYRFLSRCALMNPRSKEIVKELHSLEPKMYMDAGPHQNRQTALMGELLVLLAEDQAKAADQLERHTGVLLGIAKALLDETKLLRWLTVALLIFTAALLVFTIRPIVAP